MIIYVTLAGVVAAVAVALVVLGRRHLPLTTVGCIIGVLLVGLIDRARSHETTPIWHWGALSVGMPVTMALVAAVLMRTRLHPAWQMVLVFAAGLVALAMIAAYVARASSS